MGSTVNCSKSEGDLFFLRGPKKACFFDLFFVAQGFLLFGLSRKEICSMELC